MTLQVHDLLHAINPHVRSVGRQQSDSTLALFAHETAKQEAGARAAGQMM